MKTDACVLADNNTLIIKGPLTFDTVKRVFNESESYFVQDRVVQIDLSHVEKTNSAALALMIEWVKHAKKNNVRLSFLNLPENLTTLLTANDLSLLLT